MTRLAVIAAAAVSLGLATAARAGEVKCWFEGGVIVVPAEAAGIAGDFILDTGTAQTTLHETAAQTAGIDVAALAGDVRLAGQTVRAAPLAVADLDVRTWNLPTPVAGVIGADVLKGWVVEVTYAPCRVRVWRPGAAPAPFRGRSLPLAWDQGVPMATAAVADDAHELAGPFVIATGANAPVRLADDLAQAPGAAKPNELYPRGVWLARLGQVRFAGATGVDVAAGLMPPEGRAAGVLGGEVLAHFRLRFDFAAGRLIVAPARP